MLNASTTRLATNLHRLHKSLYDTGEVVEHYRLAKRLQQDAHTISKFEVSIIVETSHVSESAIEKF